MSRIHRLALAAFCLGTALVIAAAMAPQEALAASKISKNVGGEAKAWGTALVGGVAALAGLPALMKREFNQALLVAGIALLIGGFVYAEGTVKTVIETLWKTAV